MRGAESWGFIHSPVEFLSLIHTHGVIHTYKHYYPTSPLEHILVEWFGGYYSIDYCN